MDKLFGQQANSMIINGAREFTERAHFRQALQLDDEDGLAKIPCLNDVELAESVPPFSLVRYRCLVQDVFEPELYTPVLKEVDESTGSSRLVSTKYRECVEPIPGRRLESVDGCFAQRGACYCVPLPGEREWARRVAAEWTVACGGSTHIVQTNQAKTPSTATKRGRPDDDVNMASEEEVTQRQRVAQPVRSSNSAAPILGKTLGNGVVEGLKTSEDFGLNFPIASEERLGRGASTACIVKLYDDDAEALRVCSIVEVIGVLCVNPEIADLLAGAGSMEDAWRDARNPSTALVPRLHAVAIRPLPFYHPLLPYTSSWLSEARLATAFKRQFAVSGALASARSAAVEHLANNLYGDSVAAEYMLMLLASRSFAQHGEKSLGYWSLNLASWPQASHGDVLAAAAGELVPRAVHVEVSAETLNARRWRPRKDFVANRLVASQLQLAPGSLLMLDETKMGEGQLSTDGVKNLLAIQQLVTDSRLVCDFMSYDVKVPLEVSCVVMSNRKSIVKDVDVRLPLRVNGAASNANIIVSETSLDAARWLLSLVTRSPRAARIPDDVMSAFAEDFAALRQKFKVREDLANTWMCLARARCLTFGEEEVTMQRWREVIELERMRLTRCHEDGMLEN
jgi:hypothetical protein